jgi:hypothetical protein
MTRQLKRLLVLVLTAAAIGCSPPELTAMQEERVGRCLELAHKQETSPECSEITKPMEKAYLEKHPDFYDRLLADRKAFVEERIAADQREGDALEQCIDAREAGNITSTACRSFTSREIKRAAQDRRLTGCAVAQLDGRSDARRRCSGLTEQQIEDEVQAERVRRQAAGAEN